MNIDLTNKQFGRWTVVSKAPTTRTAKGVSVVKWIVNCSCGNQKQVRTANLVNGSSTSCGCITTERCRRLVGELSPTWKRGFVHDDSGYKLIRLPQHHRAKSNGYVREHIVVMETLLGRHLLPHEQVHHRNGIKDDNRPENLELWSKSQPSGQRVEDKIKWAKEILEQYKDYEKTGYVKGLTG